MIYSKTLLPQTWLDHGKSSKYSRVQDIEGKIIFTEISNTIWWYSWYSKYWCMHVDDMRNMINKCWMGSVAVWEERSRRNRDWKKETEKCGKEWDRGVFIISSSSIFLVDHAWTYRVSDCRPQLEQIPGLLERMAALMDVQSEERTKEEIIEDILQQMWK